MKIWEKLIYFKLPEGVILLRWEIDGIVKLEAGKFMPYGKNDTSVFIPCNPFSKVISMDSIYFKNPHYIKIEDLEMPNEMD